MGKFIHKGNEFGDFGGRILDVVFWN